MPASVVVPAGQPATGNRGRARGPPPFRYEWIRLMVRSPTTSTLFGSGAKSSFGPNFCPVVSAQKIVLRSSAAFDVLSGTITYVNVEIGYASLNFFGGSTIESSLF